MGENSKIEWTTHTFNPWIGCTKVSPGCANCYAEREMDHRHGKAKWGKGNPRTRTAPSTWAQPLKWDRAAAKAGRRDRVFCASLADVFDPEVPIGWLADLFVLIEKCRNLDWLLLTKRPELIMSRIQDAHISIEGIVESWDEKDGQEPCCPASDMLNDWEESPPAHVWIGTSVEDQKRAEERIPHLLAVPATKHFLSCEPLLGLLDLAKIHTGETCEECTEPVTRDAFSSSVSCACCVEGPEAIESERLAWVIVGGESGPSARSTELHWVRSLRDQAVDAGCAFHFKQWGEWCPAPSDPDGQNVRVGKSAAGRLLDGRTWDEVPA